MRRKVTEGEMLNNACRIIADQTREIRWLKKQVRDLLGVADTVLHAGVTGDWDILVSASRGARRILNRRRTLKAVGYPATQLKEDE